MLNELIVSSNPKSSISEAIKLIRTNLLFSSVDEKIKSVLVTSSLAGEGKSFTSANLAVAFAQTGAKVLVVDCDMRRGRQHRIFDVENKIGLSNLLLGDIKEYENYICKTKIHGVSVLPRGIVPHNPPELLASTKNEQLIKLLEKEYDLIIYDGVPVGGFTDSIIMANLCDRIVVVSAYKMTPMECLKDTKKSLASFEKKIAGVVLNRVEQSKSSYYKAYYE